MPKFDAPHTFTQSNREDSRQQYCSQIGGKNDTASGEGQTRGRRGHQGCLIFDLVFDDVCGTHKSIWDRLDTGRI